MTERTLVTVMIRIIEAAEMWLNWWIKSASFMAVFTGHESWQQVSCFHRAQRPKNWFVQVYFVLNKQPGTRVYFCSTLNPLVSWPMMDVNCCFSCIVLAAHVCY